MIFRHAFLKNWWYRIPQNTSNMLNSSLANRFLDIMNMQIIQGAAKWLQQFQQQQPRLTHAAGRSRVINAEHGVRRSRDSQSAVKTMIASQA